MKNRRVYDLPNHAHFLTFSCYKRRRLLDLDPSKRIVLGTMTDQLSKQTGHCVGFVLMPNHVHAIVWFASEGQLSRFMKQWKQRSSVSLKRHIRDHLPTYGSVFDSTDPVWQPRYYDFSIYTEAKLIEKLKYMHENPVRSGLVSFSTDWPWSSARYYDQKRSVGVPIQWPS